MTFSFWFSHFYSFPSKKAENVLKKSYITAKACDKFKKTPMCFFKFILNSEGKLKKR